MSKSASLRFLVLTTAFLSAEATFARNSFSSTELSVVDNTLKSQSSGVYRATNPDPANVKATQIDREISTDRSNNLSSSDVKIAVNPTENRFGTDEDNSFAHPPQFNPRTTLASEPLPAAQSYRISGVPTEASIVIPVPPPLTQSLPSVTQVIKAQPIKYGVPRSIRPTSSPTNFSQTNPNAFSRPAAYINNGATAANSEFIYPLQNIAPVTSGYGWRTHPLTGSRRFHSGIDIGAPTGTPVLATGSGTIVWAGWKNGYGKTVVIQHSDTKQTLYGHLSEISVQMGQTVTTGIVIGAVGSTGNSTGPHLHYETRTPDRHNNWAAINPTEEIRYATDNLRRSLPYARQETSPTGF